jgi:hypothetical protein
MTPSEPHVKIVSDGNYFGTQVLVDGTPLQCVKAATWTIGPEPSFAKVTLELEDVAVELGGSEFDAKVIASCKPKSWLGRRLYRLARRRDELTFARAQRKGKGKRALAKRQLREIREGRRA